MANFDQNGPKTLDGLVHCAQNATSAAGILACGLGYFQRFEIDLVSYHGDSPGAPAILYRFDGEGAVGAQWHSQFLDVEKLRESPVEALARQQVMPIYWSDVARTARLTSAEGLYMKGLMRRYPNDGISLRVHGPGGDSAVVGLGFAAKQARLPRGRCTNFSVPPRSRICAIAPWPKANRRVISACPRARLRCWNGSPPARATGSLPRYLGFRLIQSIRLCGGFSPSLR
ncbi:hypothetical protein FCK22_12360 [Sulfitobacter sp. 15WGC]|nr:hypothetical protein FCK22_12360 [Sulfitobacter sp. 15WGC]